MKLWLYWENKPGFQTPPYIELCRETVYRHCGGLFEVVLVTPENIQQFLPNLRGDLDQIRRFGDVGNTTNIAIKTAYIRVELLFLYGGVWLDSDMLVVRSFKPVFDRLLKYNFVGYKHWFGHVVNNFLASNKGGRVISLYKKQLDSILDNTKLLQWGDAGARTITPIALMDDNTYLFEKKSFHPIHYQEKDKFFMNNLNIEYFMDESTMCFALFNDLFPEGFKLLSRERILSDHILISDIFNYALYDRKK